MFQGNGADVSLVRDISQTLSSLKARSTRRDRFKTGEGRALAAAANGGHLPLPFSSSTYSANSLTLAKELLLLRRIMSVEACEQRYNSYLPPADDELVLQDPGRWLQPLLTNAAAQLLGSIEDNLARPFGESADQLPQSLELGGSAWRTHPTSQQQQQAWRPLLYGGMQQRPPRQVLLALADAEHVLKAVNHLTRPGAMEGSERGGGLLRTRQPARVQVVRSALSALSETCCPAPDGGGSGGPSSSSQGCYDAVVMDADFPVLDGIEAAARIRHWHAHLAAPPPLLLLVLPASPRDPAAASRVRSLEAAALQAGADVVLHGIDELRTVDLELLLQKREAAAGRTTTFMQAAQLPPPPMAADRDSLPPASSLQVDTSPFAALTAVALLHHQLSSSSSDPATLCDHAAFPPFPLGDHRFAPSAMADGSMADMAGEDDRSRSSAGPFQRSRSSSSERLSLSGPPTDRGLPDLPPMSAGGFGDAGGGPGGKRISRACQRCHDMKVSCTGGRPCHRCTRLGRVCTEFHPKPRRARGSGGGDEAGRQSLKRPMEAEGETTTLISAFQRGGSSSELQHFRQRAEM